MVGIWCEPLNADQKKERGISPGGMALRVSFLFPDPEWKKTRGELTLNDIIVDINGKRLPEMTTRQFHSYFRLTFNVGDTATLSVLRGNQPLKIQVPCLDLGDEW